MQILEANENNIGRDEVERNRQIIMAENRLTEIVIDAITSLRALKTYGFLYIMCNLLLSLSVYRGSRDNNEIPMENIPFYELIIWVLDVSLGCLLWMTFRD